MISIINIREHPQWVELAADYFSSKWKVDRQLYLDSITDSLTTENPVPRWYLMQRGEDIIGCYGLIENDFMVRDDLCPWLCALYIEPAERRQQLGAKLLAHSRREAKKLGYDKVYLNTDHIGYYEKYGWSYIGNFAHQSGDDARVYESAAIRELKEMSAFFDTVADSYDSHMLNDLELDVFYEAIDNCFDKPVKRLLDLGCGTGLELERLYKRFPDMYVTGIDMSGEMLKRLAQKYPGKNLRLIQGSYFDVDFGGDYDYVLSTYSLHHFSEEMKLSLYKKVYIAMQPGGVFVFGDYTVATTERMKELAAENYKRRREQNIPEGEFYHFDTPFTPEVEIKLMKAAGFTSPEIIRQWDRTSIIVARK